MEQIHVFRHAVAKHTAGQLGLRVEQPTRTVSNQKAQLMRGDIYAMPTDANNWQPLQDLTPGSSTFGAFFFLPDYSIPGGPDIVL